MDWKNVLLRATSIPLSSWPSTSELQKMSRLCCLQANVSCKPQQDVGPHQNRTQLVKGTYHALPKKSLQVNCRGGKVQHQYQGKKTRQLAKKWARAWQKWLAWSAVVVLGRSVLLCFQVWKAVVLKNLPFCHLGFCSEILAFSLWQKFAKPCALTAVRALTLLPKLKDWEGSL